MMRCSRSGTFDSLTSTSSTLESNFDTSMEAITDPDSYISEDDTGLVSDQHEICSPDEQVKIKVSDIFNMFQTTKVKRQETQVQAKDALIDKDTIQRPEFKISQPKSGITAGDILTGAKQGAKKALEKKSEILPLPPKSGITAKDILIGKPKTMPEPIEICSEDESESCPINNKPLIVKFKYRSHEQKIVELENKIRESTRKSVSARQMFKMFDKKKEFFVTLNMNPSKLKEIPQSQSVYHTEGTKIKGATSYLDLLRDSNVSAKNPIHKLKEVPVPESTREQLHVTYPQSPIQHKTASLPLKTNHFKPNIDYTTWSMPIPMQQAPHLNFTIEHCNMTHEKVEELAEKFVPNFCNIPRYRVVADLMRKNSISKAEFSDLWTSYLQPHNAEGLLIDPKVMKCMKNWLWNSFSILKKTTKRHNFKRPKRTENNLDGFIDDIDDNGLTEDEAYTPLMIIAGPTGVGKTSIAFALAEEVSAYVYEINASQSRGKKDISANLKELSTTQLVHQNQEIKDLEDGFQKGVILFEDVDILFESDRGFWSVLESVLTISRRPVILTCTDLSLLPESIKECALNESSLYELKKTPRDELVDYFSLVALANRVQIDRDVLENLVEQNDNDLRKCLSNLQFLCEIPHNQFLHIGVSTKPHRGPSDKLKSLELYSFEANILSNCDVIRTGSVSAINHDITRNEVLSAAIYIHDDELRIPPLPFEFNAANELAQCLPEYNHWEDNFDIPKMKAKERAFYKSKIRKPKRITRSTFEFPIFNSSEVQENTSMNVLPNAKYFTDISPFVREFARFDQKIQSYNHSILHLPGQNRSLDDLIRDGIMIKKRFQKDPTSILKKSFGDQSLKLDDT